MTRYVEASPRARQWFFLAAAVWAGLALLTYRFNAYFPLSRDAPDFLAQVQARALNSFLALVVFYSALSGVAIVLAVKSVRTGQWPPVGMPVPFRSQIREIHKPFKVWLFVGSLIAMCVAHIVLAGCQTAVTNAMLQEAAHLLNAVPSSSRQ